MASYTDPQTVHNPATGTSPPAAWGDTVRDDIVYLYDRGPYICTSATRPAAPIEGQQIYETDTNKSLVFDGASWWTIGIAGNLTTTYAAPAVTQSGSVTVSVDASEYRIISGVCEWWFRVTVSGSGSAGNTVTVSLPVTATGTFRHVGEGTILDNSASTIDSGVWETITTTTIGLLVGEGTTNYWGITPNIALAANDSIRGHVRFRVASAA